MADKDGLHSIWMRHKGRMRNLISGKVEPTSENEREFLDFVNGHKSVETPFEQCWNEFASQTTKPEREVETKSFTSTKRPTPHKRTFPKKKSFAAKKRANKGASSRRKTPKKPPSERKNLMPTGRSDASARLDRVVPKGQSTICPKCGGDGGVGSGCTHCRGTGWINNA